MQKIKINNLEKKEYAQREAYNFLRTNLQFCGPNIKKIMLTSCAMHEGKSTVSFELARSIAESGKKVCFIDADMRKSVIENRYDVQPGVKGLSHLLSAQEKDVIYETNVKNLYVVFAGRSTPNPSELLNGAIFPAFLEMIENSFEYIIIDTPPLGSVIDAAVIAPHCDGAVLVMESGLISRRMAQDVKRQIEMANCKLLGVVLNKVDRDSSGYYYKYGKYGRYGKYYKKYGKYYKKYGNYGYY